VENTGWEGLEWSIFMFGAPKVVPPPVSIEDRSSGPVNKIDYVLTHTGFMGSHKLSSFDSC
jgi:hypothetical protein